MCWCEVESVDVWTLWNFLPVIEFCFQSFRYFKLFLIKRNSSRTLQTLTNKFLLIFSLQIWNFQVKQFSETRTCDGVQVRIICWKSLFLSKKPHPMGTFFLPNERWFEAKGRECVSEWTFNFFHNRDGIINKKSSEHKRLIIHVFHPRIKRFALAELALEFFLIDYILILIHSSTIWCKHPSHSEKIMMGRRRRRRCQVDGLSFKESS